MRVTASNRNNSDLKLTDSWQEVIITLVAIPLSLLRIILAVTPTQTKLSSLVVYSVNHPMRE